MKEWLEAEAGLPPPFSDEELAYLRESAPPPPRGYGTGAAAPGPSDSTTGRLAQLGRLRALLWHVLRTKAT